MSVLKAAEATWTGAETSSGTARTRAGELLRLFFRLLQVVLVRLELLRDSASGQGPERALHDSASGQGPESGAPDKRVPSPPEAPPCFCFASIRILTPGCSTPPPDIQRPEESNPVRRITGLLCLNWGIIYLLSKMDGGKRALQSTVYE